MNYYSELQRLARERLRGYWLRAIAALCTVLAVNSVVSLLYQISMVYMGIDENSVTYAIWYYEILIASSIISAPFSFGFERFFWIRSAGEGASVAEIFYFFGSIRRLVGSIVLQMIKFVISWLPTVLFAVPLLPIKTDLIELAYPWSMMLPVVFGVLLICAAVYGLFMSIRLFAVDYIYIGEEVGVFRAIGRSFKLTKGRIKYVFILLIRFLPWMLLNITGFAQLYTQPYFEMTKCLFIRDMLAYSAVEVEADEASRAPVAEETAVFASPEEAGEA